MWLGSLAEFRFCNSPCQFSLLYHIRRVVADLRFKASIALSLFLAYVRYRTLSPLAVGQSVWLLLL